MHSESSYTITAQNLDIGYHLGSGKSIKIITGLNFAIKEGEMTCLMGQNGIGKSTLIRTIAGLQPTISGDLQVSSKPISAYSTSELSKSISVVLTTLPFIGNLRVRQIVEMGRYPHTSWFHKLNSIDQELIEMALNVTGTEELREEVFQTLSDGQKQKVLIARAIAQDSDIMILDEPTSHLDLNNRIEIMTLLSELAKRGKTILVSTHEMDLALQISNRLLLILPDKSVSTGIPEDLVLNGAIDETFKLKGYDLKTGRIIDRAYNHTVQLKGEGYLYLWTKNALERNEFKISDDAKIAVSVSEQDSNPIWRLGENENLFNSMEELIQELKRTTKL